MRWSSPRRAAKRTLFGCPPVDRSAMVITVDNIENIDFVNSTSRD